MKLPHLHTGNINRGSERLDTCPNLYKRSINCDF